MNARLKYMYKQMARSMNSHTLGRFGEDILREHLEAQGYIVMHTVASHCGDLTVVDADSRLLKIEVKTARRGLKTRRWHFRLRKNDKHGVTSISDSDVVVLLQMNKLSIDTYVVPVSFFGKRQKSFTISNPASEYTGKLKPFLQKISNLDLFKFNPLREVI